MKLTLTLLSFSPGLEGGEGIVRCGTTLNPKMVAGGKIVILIDKIIGYRICGSINQRLPPTPPLPAPPGGGYSLIWAI